MFAVDTARPPPLGGPLFGFEVGESERLTRSSFMLSCVGKGFSDRVVGEFRNFWRRLQIGRWLLRKAECNNIMDTITP